MIPSVAATGGSLQKLRFHGDPKTRRLERKGRRNGS